MWRYMPWQSIDEKKSFTFGNNWITSIKSNTAFKLFNLKSKLFM